MKIETIGDYYYVEMLKPDSPTQLRVERNFKSSSWPSLTLVLKPWTGPSRMVFTDQTPVFRSVIADRQSPLSLSTRSKSPVGVGRSSSRSRDLKGKGKDVIEGDEFLKEAYRIVSPLAQLKIRSRAARADYVIFDMFSPSRSARPSVCSHPSSRSNP